MNDGKIIRGQFGIGDCHIMIMRKHGDRPTTIMKHKKDGTVFIECKDIEQGIEAYYFAAENYKNLETFGN